jgi:protocatechuate 3,4-dioxygenase, beta subunit
MEPFRTRTIRTSVTLKAKRNQMNARKLLTFATLLPLVAMAGPAIQSGIQVGDRVLAFDPHHVTGPEAGKRTCPTCKYSGLPAVQVWFHMDDELNAGRIAKVLEAHMVKKKSAKFKAFVIFIRPKVSKESDFSQVLAKFSKTYKLKEVGVAYLNQDQTMAINSYKFVISPDVKNNVFVYRKNRLRTQFTNLYADKEGLKSMTKAIEEMVAAPK